MKQGTISVIFGCHSPIHSLLVLRSWKILYGKYPKFWQIICIFLHDIGHIGKNYLDDFEEKKKHWELGAGLAYDIIKFIYGSEPKSWDAFEFCAGHCNYSGYPKSKLHKVDKYSWYIAPKWWLYLNTIFEPKIAMGYSRMEAVNKFKEQVKKSIESNEYKSTHDMYLERCNGK